MTKAKRRPPNPTNAHPRRRKLRPAKEAARARRLSNQGAELLQTGQAQEANSVLARAYALMPGDVPTAINLGGAYILNKQYKEAIPILERARDCEPENEMVWINLGAACLGNPILAEDEQQLQAIAAFERALEINPIAKNVHYSLGLIHRDRGEIEQAIQRFQQAVQADPMDAHARRAGRQLGEGQDAARE